MCRQRKKEPFKKSLKIKNPRRRKVVGNFFSYKHDFITYSVINHSLGKKNQYYPL